MAPGRGTGAGAGAGASLAEVVALGRDAGARAGASLAETAPGRGAGAGAGTGLAEAVPGSSAGAGAGASLAEAVPGRVASAGACAGTRQTAAAASQIHEEAEANETAQVDDNDDGIYDVDLLPRDPGKRIPIADYDINDQDRVVLKNAPKKSKMIDHKIQKDLISSYAKETTKLIMEDLGNEHFFILADESSDVSLNEQLALCLRYVDKKGKPVERFLGVVNVEDTTSSTLKTAIGNLLMDHQLSFSMVRGQGYDGASNMKGHINGLKKLIMDESPSAYYVHCFAHQLQLTLVVVAKESGDCQWFFQQLSYLLNVLGNSCKKIKMLRVAQAESIIESLELGELESGQGLNQEMGLGRPGDTRWGSHYKTILHIIALYQPIRKTLIKIGEDYNRTEAISAQTMLTSFESFEFVFMLHLMEEIFGYTDDLGNALQKREQDIVDAISLVYTTKEQLQLLREDGGWDTFLQGVISFCVKHKIKIADMDGHYKPVGRSARFYGKATNKHRFHVDMFLGVIDRQLRELNDRFDEVNTELLICMASFNPIDSFAAFDKENLVKLAQFYPTDFTKDEMLKLPNQLRNYIADVRRDERFKDVKTFADLSINLIETKKNGTFEVVYKLLKLVLILPVATASVERVFSSMTYVKNKLRNKIGSQYMNDCLVTFIERDFFLQVEDDIIIAAFQKTRNRKVELVTCAACDFLL
ncbi:uncharacterized protein LOC133908020 [Phragmites australis]|uniref:uncharacterized protein LOC133908020 n=1 Tax=Phragmites australis TaxID=29695 RepID=UPI002D76FC8F|nr:uncharacterized protein LOC133908020 [Phragmites australis]